MSNFIDDMHRWRDKCEADAFLIPGPQLVDGWHNGFVPGPPAQVVCGVWAGSNGNRLERAATPDPSALAAMPHLHVEERSTPPGADPDAATATFAAMFGLSSGSVSSLDAFTYTPVPPAAGAPGHPPGTTVYEYEVFNYDGQGAQKVGALYRQIVGNQWFEHWVLFHQYQPPRIQTGVRVRIDKSAGASVDLATFLAAHQSPTSRYALVEYTWQ